MRASLVVSALATLVLPALPLRAVEVPDKPEATPKTQESSEKTDAPGKSPSPSPKQLKSILDESLSMIRELANMRLDPPALAAFPGQAIVMPTGLSKEIQADTDLRIGRARLKLDDRAGARAAWQAALDATAEIGYSPDRRTALYVEIARAQLEGGDRDEVRFTLRQALQSARSIHGQPSNFPQPTVVVGFPSDHLARKADALRQIAQVQALMGEGATAAETIRQALETANAIQQPLNRITALLRLAPAEPADVAKAAVSQAMEIAMSEKTEFSKAKAIETVLRGRVRALQVDEVLTLIAERLGGNLQNYALWVVADAVASSDRPFAPESMTRLIELATKARFDQASRKIKVFRRLADAQARLGDYEGAYRSVGVPHPANNVDIFRATLARIQVMKAVAEAQLKAKDREAARDTVLVALEMITPLPDADAESYFPLTELGMLQAKVGDLAGALRTAAALNSGMSKVRVLGEVAAGYAREDRREEAHKTIRLALEAARNVPDDTLWSDVAQYGPPAPFAPGINPMLPVLQVLAPAQARADDLDGALKTVAAMGTSPWLMYNRNSTLGQIVEARLAVGDLTGARRAIDVIDDSNAMPTYIPAEQDSDGNILLPDQLSDAKAPFLERVARRQAEQGDPAVVMDWVQKQSKSNVKLRMLRGLADGIAARASAKTEATKPARAGAQAKSGD